MRPITFMLLGHLCFAVVMWDFRQTPYWLAVYFVILAGWLTKRALDKKRASAKSDGESTPAASCQ